MPVSDRCLLRLTFARQILSNAKVEAQTEYIYIKKKKKYLPNRESFSSTAVCKCVYANKNYCTSL